jgi:hypothetical protein
VRETRAVANFQNRRSDGIEDLRSGALIDDDGREADPDEFCGTGAAKYGSSRTPRTTSSPPRPLQPPSAVFRDHLVCPHSASGRGPADTVRKGHGLELTGCYLSTCSTIATPTPACGTGRHEGSQITIRNLLRCRMTRWR